MDIEEVKKQAELEIKTEDFRAAVDKYKEKLRNRKGLWNRLFPWKIIIIRKDQNV